MFPTSDVGDCKSHSYQIVTVVLVEGLPHHMAHKWLLLALLLETRRVSTVSMGKMTPVVYSTSCELLYLSGLATVVKPAVWQSSFCPATQTSMDCLFRPHKGSLFYRGHDAKSLQAWDIWMTSNFYSQESCSNKHHWMRTLYKGVQGEAQHEMGSYKTSSALEQHKYITCLRSFKSIWSDSLFGVNLLAWQKQTDLYVWSDTLEFRGLFSTPPVVKHVDFRMPPGRNIQLIWEPVDILGVPQRSLWIVFICQSSTKKNE